MKRTLSRTALYLTLGVFAFVALYPVFWMFACAGKTREEAAKDMWGLPGAWTWDNFAFVLLRSNFPRYALNSLVVTASAVAITLVAAALAAFAFARLRFRGGTVLFVALLAGMMVPVHIVLVPLLKLFGALGLNDTRTAVTAAYVAISLPVSVFILRGFFEGVPRELEEAARIDGCSDARLFWHVMLPMARPALAVVAIFNAVTLWNEFVFALTLLTTPERMTIPLGMFEFSDQYSSDVPRMCAALALSVLPMFLVYLLAQKHIIRGLTGAVKG